MKATLAGLALSTAVFAAQAEPPKVDNDAQTITWVTKARTSTMGNEVWTVEALNCRFGTLTTRTNAADGGVAVVDLASLASATATRTTTMRDTCKKYGLTPGF